MIGQSYSVMSVLLACLTIAANAMKPPAPGGAYFCVMRHSKRLDTLSLGSNGPYAFLQRGSDAARIPGLTKIPAYYKKAHDTLARGRVLKCDECGGEHCESHPSFKQLKKAYHWLEETKGRMLEKIPVGDWPDRKERPYDTPIRFDSKQDKKLPVDAAEQIRPYNFQRIVSSPFRRSLQTASLVAQTLGIRRVDVHCGLGEGMKSVAKELKENHLQADDFCYLSREQMQEALDSVGDQHVDLGEIMGPQPDMNENAEVAGSRSFVAFYRHEDTMMHLKQKYASKNVLVVSHAKSLYAAGWPRGKKYGSIPECGWLLIRNDGEYDGHGTVVKRADGIDTKPFSSGLEAEQYLEEYEMFRDIHRQEERLYDPREKATESRESRG